MNAAKFLIDQILIEISSMNTPQVNMCVFKEPDSTLFASAIYRQTFAEEQCEIYPFKEGNKTPTSFLSDDAKGLCFCGTGRLIKK